MEHVINISAKLFTIITKTQSNPGNIHDHLPLVFARIRDGAGKKVCIIDAQDKPHWFDDQQQPTTPEKRKYPSLARQAMNVSASAVKAFNEAFTKDPDGAMGGRVLASEEEKQRRLDICGTCELFDATKKRCTKCGCNMPWKVALKSATCPHPEGDKWVLTSGSDGPALEDTAPKGNQ